MRSDLRILVLEDNPDDAALMLRTLQRTATDSSVACVQTREDFARQLHDLKPELIIADYSLPAFTAYEALTIASRDCPQAPFLIVSGTVDEEMAVESLKRGAADVVLKSQLARVPLVAERALRDVGLRQRAKAAAEEREAFVSALADAVGEPVFVTDGQRRLVLVNEAFCRFLGAARDQILGRSADQVFSAEQARLLAEQDERVLKSGQGLTGTLPIRCPSGAEHTIKVLKTPYTDKSGRRFIIGTFANLAVHQELERNLR